MSQGVVTPPEIAAEIQARRGAGESLSQVAERYAMSKQGVSDIGKGEHGGSPARVSSSLLTVKKHETASEYEELSRKAREQAYETIEKAGPYQATMIAAVATDKALLLRGDATSRVEHVRDLAEGIDRPGVAEALVQLVRAALPPQEDAQDAEYVELPALPAGEQTSEGEGQTDIQ